MNDGFLRELSRLQRYAVGLGNLVREAEAAAPARAEGSDHSGAVRAVLGRDGLPQSFRVHLRWDRMLAPESFGSAVLAACQNAMGERLAVWKHKLDEDGWKDRADALGADDNDVTPGAGVPTAFQTPSGPGASRRRLDEVAEDMLQAFDGLNRLTSRSASPDAGTGAGSVENEHLTITLSRAGLLSCCAEPSWVSEQPATRLRNALGTALSAAKDDLASNPSTADAQPGNLDRLVAETLEILGNPERYT